MVGLMSPAPWMRLPLDKCRFPTIWLHQLTVANRRYECRSAPPASEILSGAPLEHGSTTTSRATGWAPLTGL